MAKVAIVAVLAAVAYLVFRPGPASADKVAGCLQSSGATVTETQLLAGLENLPTETKSRLLEVEKRNYDVQLGYDSGVLLLVRSAKSAEEAGRSLDAANGPGSAHRAGRFVMYWYAAPSSESAGIVERCLS